MSGQEDLPDEAEFREAVAQAYAAAKAMGNAPDGALRRIVDELLTPQVDWRDLIRLLLTGRLGNHAEDWSRPNRRRLALAPIVILPSRKGYGCDTVAVGVDTSGSIGKRELLAFMSEVGGVLADCKPRRIIVLGCDSHVHKVEEVRALEDVGVLARDGLGGGGGTDFRPVFSYCEENNIRPEALIYLTDGLGRFPHEAPAYPTVWAMTTDVQPPFGETVRIKL
jgi:predicted metal-dependent peptidase